MPLAQQRPFISYLLRGGLVLLILEGEGTDFGQFWCYYLYNQYKIGVPNQASVQTEQLLQLVMLIVK